ncbi:glycosyl transferase [Bacillus sp. FJAT-27231]|uniref:glycosyltransferase family 4 protein n=1 Tax=Bacillus sp. FJAT-27231 TaxID=1679168 RepID=UPI000670ABCB|nr:glycosyltransferase family 4 protein [Bacillus sp. FJAT-27231]KMY55634.1 glycosyl transferase [Bacillus sp. FJAT-27231]
MKVLHFITGAETGGSRKHVITLLEQFAQDEVTLAVMQEGPFAEEARQKGIRTEVFSQSSRYDLSILKKIVQFIQKEKFDILHTHGPRANLFGIYIKKKTGIQWVTTVHSDPALDFVKSGLKGRLFTTLSMYAIRKMDAYFAVSERFKQNLVKLGIDASKIQTVYNGIHFTKETAQPIPRNELGVTDEDFVMAMVARLHPIKGHTIVFEAMKQIEEEKRPHLLLVGDGPIKDELEKEVERLQLNSHVHFLGFRSDVDQIYTASDLALLASYSESFPLALLEAANQHVPIVTTDVGGVKELVENGKTGWIVPVKSTAGYTEALRKAIECKDAGELTEMGDKLYHFASQHFSLEKLKKATKDLYTQLINKK